MSSLPSKSSGKETERNGVSNPLSPKWGLMRPRSWRNSELAVPVEVPSSPSRGFRRISESAFSKFKAGVGVAVSAAKRKSSMKQTRRATSQDRYVLEEDDEVDEEEERVPSARLSRTDSASPHLESVNVQCGGASCRGRLKRHNEDRISIVPHLVNTEVNKNASVGFAGVFDGHAGELCVNEVSTRLSVVVSQEISKLKNNDGLNWETVTRTGLMNAILDMDKEFLSIANSKRDFSGSCGVVAIVRGCEVTVAHVGDCCAFLINKEGVTRRLTRDHNVRNQKEIERVTAQGGKIIEGRFNGVLEPTRAFGDADIKQELNGLTCDPETMFLVVEAGNTLVLCTDGVTAAYNEQQIGELVSKDLIDNDYDPSHAAAMLCKTAAEICTDDTSCIVIIFQP